MLFRIRHIFPSDDPKRLDKRRLKLEEKKKDWAKYEDMKRRGVYRKRKETLLNITKTTIGEAKTP